MGDYTELKRLAEAATKSKWCTDGWRQVMSAESDQLNSGFVIVDCQGPDNLKNAEFVAAANPAAVLALIAENERLAGGGQLLVLDCEDLKAERDQLKAENEALRNSLGDCADSLHAEMLQKFHGELPEDMHPVTRREYDRDMTELAGYRAATSKEAVQ